MVKINYDHDKIIRNKAGFVLIVLWFHLKLRYIVQIISCKRNRNDNMH